MTISESADNDPRKGIAALTTLGRTKKKGSSFGQKISANHVGVVKKGVVEHSNFIAVSDASKPVDLKISLRPTISNPSASVLGPSNDTTKTRPPTQPHKAEKHQELLAADNLKSSPTPFPQDAPDKQMLLQAHINAQERITLTEAFRSKHRPQPNAPGHHLSASQPKDLFRPAKDSVTNSESSLPSHTPHTKKN